MSEHTHTPELVAELLEALEWAMGKISKPRLVRGQNDKHCEEYAKACAAIARARGEG